MCSIVFRIDTNPSHLLDIGAQVLSSIGTQLSKHLCRDLLWGKLFAHHWAVDLHFLPFEVHLVGHLLQLLFDFIGLATNKALHRVKGVLRVHHSLQIVFRHMKSQELHTLVAGITV